MSKRTKIQEAQKTPRHILITGGLGFIGFNAVKRWKQNRPNYRFSIVDIETYAAQFMLDEKKQWCKESGVKTYKYDIRKDSAKIEKVISEEGVTDIVHFAAESHVDNSIKNPNIFFETNVIGTVNILNLAKEYNLRIHCISTDEVYGITYPEDDCFEDHPLDPSSPYSSSKTSADLIALSYFKTFGTKVTVSRCSNNFGPYQHPEKLIPTVISKAMKDQKIPVYGKGNQRRHWIHVDEHNDAVLSILETKKPGGVYNIAPTKENYVSNMTIIRAILKRMNKDPKVLVEHIADRLGHDTSYFLYSSHYFSEKEYKQDLNNTVDWYVNALSWYVNGLSNTTDGSSKAE